MAQRRYFDNLITLEENVGGCDAAARQNRNDSGGQFVDFYAIDAFAQDAAKDVQSQIDALKAALPMFAIE